MRARLFRKVPELPDDLERVATWVEVLTGLTLDAGQGTIQVLDNAAWRERRERLEQRGGPPETGGGPRLDPILFGTDPMARGRVLMRAGAVGRGRGRIRRGRPCEAVQRFELARCAASSPLRGLGSGMRPRISLEPSNWSPTTPGCGMRGR